MAVFTVVCIVAFSGILSAESVRNEGIDKARAAARERIKSARPEKAETGEQTAPKRVTPARTPTRRAMPMGPADRAKMIKQRTQMMEEQFKKEKETHNTFIGKLQAIKKIAKSEKATKTVAELEKLIAENNSKFEKKTKEHTERLKKYSDAAKNRPTVRPRPQQNAEKAAQPGKAVKKAPGKGPKKADKK